ncbi:uncharacterized protein LOC133198896 [Saccostrea echinata]|uniref:uncharacterized protein LOC133198896 n=1 Tax=Saccostrea echinata TaxID=191078 RepID=UPI002A7FA6FA|nr:uncharacterized protein LOC133198896 [Saccostrea echinata]
MISIRFGLQRFFQKINYDIINDPDFRLSNEMFKAVLTNIKRTGKGTTQHKEIISDADMATLYSSGVLNGNSPQGLQYKVFLDVMFYTCRRGRENLRSMKKTDFVLRTDGQGRRYYLNVAQYETKNHRGSDVNDHDASSARIYEIPGDEKCPVSSLEKYLGKLNPNCESFWQRPKRHINDSDAVWYDNSPVGHNTLGNFMKTISMKAELSTLYTNHCIRATCITSLDQRGIEARHIMSVSGHKSETSIKSYSRCVSETKKQEMFDVLSSVVYPSPKLGLENPVVPTNSCTSTSESQLLNLNNCEFETVSTKQLLSEVLPDENGSDLFANVPEEKENVKVDQTPQNSCGPLFRNVGQVHIHYYMGKEQQK